MKKQIYDKNNGLSYTLHGDYYFPNLIINEEKVTYGRYGMLRKKYLKEHKSGYYQYLVLSGKLTEHLNQVDREAREAVERLVEQMTEKQGVTEKLKEDNPMEWVRWMNNIGDVVEKIICEDIIYL
ncbi:TnpV protein [Anaerobutyricum hallii]|uniref:TnpV protein n=1 Tax=Anaerobutyricum hallii TaxID=39488 RepID=A0A374N868_9FIRM|nr:TnpV protein [Anaerobutyricum hallii]RGI79921.1 TnpV protein [Anaerobutyricum hallii]